MRMKFNKSIQLLAISAASLLAASFISACATLTVDFVYVTSAKAAGPNNYGEIDVFEINSESGRMRQITTSPFPSGGRNPVAEAVSPDEADLYVVNRRRQLHRPVRHRQRRQALSAEHREYTRHLSRGCRVAGNYLYVVDTYQPLPTCTPASPCSGSVAVFPILNATQAAALSPSQPANTLGTPVVNTASAPAIGLSCYRVRAHPMSSFPPLSPSRPLAPISTSRATIPPRTSAMSSALRPTPTAPSPRSPASPFAVGTHPSAIASDATGTYLYVTDSIQNVVYGFQINGGALTALERQPIRHRRPAERHRARCHRQIRHGR